VPSLPNRLENRLAAVLAALGLLTVGAGFVNALPTMAVGLISVLILSLALGWGAALGLRPVAIYLGGCLLLYAGLILAMIALDDPTTAEPVLWGGFPRATALLVFGLWPLGTLPTILYGLRFKRDILPEERLQSFLRRYSRHRPQGRSSA